MAIIEYAPEYFEELAAAASLAGNANLQHRPFVDYYYYGNDRCRLYLYRGAGGGIVGALGLEAMSFRHREQDVEFGFGTNFFALQPGVGGYLFLHWTRRNPLGLCFGGSEDFHRIIRSQKWTYFTGVKSFYFNDPFDALPGEPAWRVLAKGLARRVTHRRVASGASRIPSAEDLAVAEETSYTADLLPQRSPFDLRFAPTVEHLAWRYSTALPFVRYRLFRVTRGHRTEAYVIWNEQPQRLMLAHCDGEDVATLACGVLLSLVELTRQDRKPRSVVLSSSHPQMQHIFAEFGFRASADDRALAIGARGRAIVVGPDTSNWLVNIDWGDNGLRAPFIGQSPSPC